MRKIRLALVMFMALFIGLGGANINVHADTATKLVVHYHRFDPNYAPWKLWLWQYTPTPGDGADYSFNGDDEFGKFMSMDLAGTPLEGSTKIGFLVKDGSWNKDVAIDRYIDLSNPNASGEVHAYIISDNTTVY